MSRCLNLTRAGDYAIAALSRLALEQERWYGPVSTRRLASLQAIPTAFLAKILASCARAGLVRTYKGAAGGVKLSREPEKITLLDVIEACEGRLARQACVFHKERLCRGRECPDLCPLRDEEERVRVRLASITLSRMAGSLRTHPGPDAA